MRPQKGHPLHAGTPPPAGGDSHCAPGHSFSAENLTALSSGSAGWHTWGPQGKDGCVHTLAATPLIPGGRGEAVTDDGISPPTTTHRAGAPGRSSEKGGMWACEVLGQGGS